MKYFFTATIKHASFSDMIQRDMTSQSHAFFISTLSLSYESKEPLIHLLRADEDALTTKHTCILPQFYTYEQKMVPDVLNTLIKCKSKTFGFS
jgi:hypothetical protein